ncbi:MAG: T9SS type A sorting domain-containing protein [Melioribacteraceae bacterium]|nr:T9SS type A sorting domain-containing protein [Melioribacteraceae bacterium]
MKFQPIIVLLIYIFLNVNYSQNGIKEEMIKEGFVMSAESAEKKADSVLALMTLEDKFAYTGGDRIFFIQPIERLGIPQVYFADATEGIHIRHEFNHKDSVYDLLGREVKTLVNEFRKPGESEVIFDAANLSSGIYLYSLKSETISIHKKMLLLK